MTDPSLSMDPTTMLAQAAEVRVPERVDPWLERRRYSFGASEVPALMMALGHEPILPTTPDYIARAARTGRVFSSKVPPFKTERVGGAAERGKAAEPEIVAWWNDNRPSGWPRVSFIAELYGTRIPEAWFPLVDRHAPRLSATPDAAAFVAGEYWNVQIKADMKGGKTAPTREFVLQVQAEAAAMAAAGSIVLYAPGWAHWDRRMRGTPRAWIVERDDSTIELIRGATSAGWARVEELRRSREEGTK